MCEPNQVAEDFLKSVNMAVNMIKKVEMFCYLGDIMCIEGRVQKAVIARIRWKME